MVTIEETKEEARESSPLELPARHIEERNDVEDEGFETASEGRSSDDERAEESESGEADALVLDDNERGRVGEEETTTTSGGIEEVENKLRHVVVGEEQSESLEEGEEQARQRGIDEANAAKAEGNSLYTQGRYVEALMSYDRGLKACPLKNPEDSGVKDIRAILYSNRAVCYSYLGNSESAAKECTKALDLNPNYLKALFRRAQAQEKNTNYEEAITDWKKVLELDPSNREAKASIPRLLPLADEKREKLKKEMIDKLKQAGNSILGRFGMSLDNFKTVQDPNTGSYSVQFQR